MIDSSEMLLSVLTPVRPEAAEHVLQTWISLRDSELPHGWTFEWCVQEDGTESTLHELLPIDDRIRYDCNGRHLGSAATRNLALLRSRGTFITSLDADDVILRGALLAMIDALSDVPAAAWVVGHEILLFPDGKRVSPVPRVASGVYDPGAIVDIWIRQEESPFKSSFVTMRSKHVWAIGGWPAVGRLDDAALVYALSVLHPGIVLDMDTFIYRRWPLQNTAQKWSEELRPRSRDFILKWLATLSSTTTSTRHNTVPLSLDDFTSVGQFDQQERAV